MGSTKLSSIASTNTRLVTTAAIFVFLISDAVVHSKVKIRFNANRAENPYVEDIFDSTAGNNQQEDLDLVQRSADQSAQLEQLIQDKSNYEENNNLSGSKEQFPVQINENEVNGIYTGDDLGEDKTPSYGKDPNSGFYTRSHRRRMKRQTQDGIGLNGSPMDRMILEKYLTKRQFQDRIKKDTAKEMSNTNSESSFKNYYEPLHLHIPIISDLAANNLDSYDGMGEDQINSNVNSNPVNVLDLMKQHRTKRSSPVLDELSMAETLRQIRENRMISPELTGLLQKRSVSYRVPSSEMLDSLIMDQDSFHHSYERQKRNPDLMDDERQGFKALELRNSGYLTPVDNESVGSGSLSRSKRSIVGSRFPANLPFPVFNLLQQNFTAFKEPYESVDKIQSLNPIETVTVSPKIKTATTTYSEIRSKLLSSESKQSPLFKVPLTKNTWQVPAVQMSKLTLLEKQRCLLICNWIRAVLTLNKLMQRTLQGNSNYLASENRPSVTTGEEMNLVAAKEMPSLNAHDDVAILASPSQNTDHLGRMKRSVLADELESSQVSSKNWIPFIKLYFKIINQQCSRLFLHDLFDAFETDILQIIKQVSNNMQLPFELSLQSQTKHFNQLLECSNNNNNGKYWQPLPLDIYKSYLDISSSPLTFQQLYPNLINSNEIEEGEPVTRLKRYKRNVIKKTLTTRVNYNINDELKKKIILLQKVTSEVINQVQTICQDYFSENSTLEAIKHLLHIMIVEFGRRDLGHTLVTNGEESQWLKISTALETCKIY